MFRPTCFLFLVFSLAVTSPAQTAPATTNQTAPTATQQTPAPVVNMPQTNPAGTQTSPAATPTTPQPGTTAAGQASTPPSEQSAPAATQQSAPATTEQSAPPAASQQTIPATTEKAAPATTQEATPTTTGQTTSTTTQQAAPMTKQQAQEAAEQKQQEVEDRQAAEENVAEVKPKIENRLRESEAVLKELMGGKTNIPNSILEKAKCIIVLPNVKKFAVSFGGSYGRGNMNCRLGDNYKGRWSAPAMYALEGGNFGLQIGLQGTDLVLVVMNDRGVDSLLRTKVRMGADVSVAAGPIGRNMQAATDVAMRAQILSYSRSRGIFAGISIEGSSLRPDNNANSILYGRDIAAREIVRGGIAVPAAAKSYVAFLNQKIPVGGKESSTQARTERN